MKRSVLSHPILFLSLLPLGTGGDAPLADSQLIGILSLPSIEEMTMFEPKVYGML